MSDAQTCGFDLSNWRTAPHNRQAFHRIGELLPTAPVSRSSERPSFLGPSDHGLQGFALQGRRGTTFDLEGFLKATATDAMIVLFRGEIAFEVYADGLGPATPHILMSSTKAVMGLIAGVLEGRGLVNLDSPASDYVPEILQTPYAAASLRHLLDMRCALPADMSPPDDYYAAAGWAPAPRGSAGRGLHAFLESREGRRAAHGGPFRYVSCNTDLLGWALERAAGRDISTLMADGLWRPLGAEHDALITLAPDGAPMCAGGLCATLRDFARLGQMIADGGRQGDVQVLPHGLVGDLETGGDRSSWAAGDWGAAFRPLGAEMSYRSGWYAVHAPAPLLFAMGVHGQNLFVDRRARVVVAKLSSWPAPFDQEAAVMTHRAVDEIVRVLTA